jgi:hypothetical protein
VFADLRSHQPGLLSNRAQCTCDRVDRLVLLLEHHLPHKCQLYVVREIQEEVRPVAPAVPIEPGGLHLLAHGPPQKMGSECSIYWVLLGPPFILYVVSTEFLPTRE